MRFAVFSLTLLTALLLNACKNKTQKTLETASIAFKKEATLIVSPEEGKTISFDVELAENNYERETGLMHRTKMEENQGMLFVFENETMRYFYMKNTSISLDLIFIDSNNTIVSIHSNAQPMSQATISSQFPAKYVLEVNAGISNRKGIKAGMKIEFNRNIAND